MILSSRLPCPTLLFRGFKRDYNLPLYSKQLLKNLLITLLLLYQFGANAQSKSDTVSILFIGNSYTYFNNLPVIVKTIAGRSGQLTHTDMAVIGGASLKRHWQDTTHMAFKKLQSRHWDFVVMQDQSQLGLQQPAPATKHWIAKPDTFYRYARLWCEEVRKQNAIPCFAMTWARDYDPSAQPLLTHAYATIARQTKARLIPVGELWQRSLSTNKQIHLHQGDGSHPSQAGSFLMALSVVQSLFPDLKLKVGYPITGLPVSTDGKPIDVSIRVQRSNQQAYTMYPSFNEVVLIGLSRQEQEQLVTISRQTVAIARSLLKSDPELPKDVSYH